MTGLVLHYFYCMKKTLIAYLWMVGFFLIFAFVMKSPTYAVFMAMIMGLTMMFSMLNIGENGGDSFLVNLPVSRREIVKSKYCFFLLGAVAVMVFGIVVGGLMNLLFREPDWLLIVVSCGAYFLLVLECVIPVALKWGVDKSRLIFFGIVVLLVVSIVMFANKLDAMLEKTTSTNTVQWLLPVGIVTVVVLLVGYLVSYRISIGVFEKKEL